MLDHPSRSTAAAHLESLGLDVSVLGAARVSAESDLRRVRALRSTAGWEDSLAAWELDRSTIIDELDSVEVGVGRLVDALVLSNHERDDLRNVLRDRLGILQVWEGAGVAGRKRLASGSTFERALGLVEAESAGLAAAIRADVEILAQSELAPRPLLSGDDLLAAGFRPGPSFKLILDEVYDAQLEGRLSQRSEAIDLARRLVAGGGDGAS